MNLQIDTAEPATWSAHLISRLKCNDFLSKASLLRNVNKSYRKFGACLCSSLFENQHPQSAQVLRDPTRRATYDAHLSSRSKFVKSAFEFDPKAPPASDSVWQDEPMGDSHVAPWVWQYRQAVKEVVRYGGEGDGLAHLIKAEFGAAVRKAYFGPEVEDLPFGEWPMEFEGR